MKLMIIVMGIVFASIVSDAAEIKNLISNPGFEYEGKNGAAQGWWFGGVKKDKSHKDSLIKLDKENPRYGKHSVYLASGSKKDFARIGQIRKLKLGSYILSVWIMGVEGDECDIQLWDKRFWSVKPQPKDILFPNNPRPGIKAKTVKLSKGKWSNFKIPFTIEKDGNILVAIGLDRKIGKVLIDDIELKKINK